MDFLPSEGIFSPQSSLTENVYCSDIPTNCSHCKYPTYSTYSLIHYNNHGQMLFLFCQGSCMINHWWLQYLDNNRLQSSVQNILQGLSKNIDTTEMAESMHGILSSNEIFSISEKTITFVVALHVKKYHTQLPRIMHVQSLHHKLRPLILEWILSIDQGTSCTEIYNRYRINCTLEKDQRSVELYILIWIYCLLACNCLIIYILY